jgi:ribose transport system permease protein
MTTDTASETASVKVVSAAQPTRTSVVRVGGFAAKNALPIGVLVLCAYFIANSAAFTSFDNLRTILVQASITMVVAVPIALLLMSGDVDLSIGSTVGLSAVVTGLGLTAWGLPTPLAIVLGVLTGAFIGLINGALIAVAGLSSLIVTLGMLAAVRGMAEVVAPDPVYGFPAIVSEFGNGRFLGVPYLVIVAVLAVACGAYFLNGTAYGKHIRSIGVSREAAFLSGIRTKTTSFWVFVLTGAAAGVGGVMLAARLNSAPSTNAGLNLELDVLTAALLGGIAMGGGRGTIRGVVLGVLFLAILANGLTILNVPPAWSTAAKGFVLVAAALLDLLARRR